MMLALEARFSNQFRAMVSMKGSETSQPVVYVGVGRENIKGASFYGSMDPRPETFQGELGFTQAFQYGTVGLSANWVGRDQKPQISAWTAVKPVPAIAIGANFKLEPTKEGPYARTVDLAVNIRDPDATIYDRPAFEIAFKSLDMGKTFSLSYFQHFVIRRKIYNVMEAKNVTHITNYVDMGAEISIEKDKMNFGVGGSWQMNKNNLIKAQLAKERIQASYIFKTWGNPAFVFAFNGGFNFKHMTPQFGLAVTCEASLGQADFDRAAANYEQVELVRYGAEAAPTVNRYDMMNDDAPILKHTPIMPEFASPAGQTSKTTSPAQTDNSATSKSNL